MKKLFMAMLVVFVFTVIAATPADAAVTIDHNGGGSHNRVWMRSWLKTIKKQHNFALIHNDVDVKTNSGINEANHNTGGSDSVTVRSDDATSTVDITNMANDAITMDPGECDCVCQQTDPEITISNNGAHSHNSVGVSDHCVNKQVQHNSAIIHNDVEVKTNSGKNEANWNTGGSVDVNSGDATSTVIITNTANTNISM